MSENKLEQISELGNKLVGSADEEQNKNQKRKRRKAIIRKVVNVMTALSVVAAVIAGILCVYYWNSAVNVFAEATSEAYSGMKDATVTDMRQNFRDWGFADGEEEYHTSNRITISIENVRETANLEVMKVSDVVYIIEDEKNQAWLKATGTGVYTVNMAAGEYVIDNERQYVLVRIPRPELKVDLRNTELLFYKDGSIFSNGSIVEGEDLARRQRIEAQTQLLEDIQSNQMFYQNAEASAITLIESLVRGFNTNIPDLQVDVEFFE